MRGVYIREKSVWTPDLTASLSLLWGEGMIASDISRRLGVSRNAVIGKAHRLKLTPRPSPLGKGHQPAIALTLEK